MSVCYWQPEGKRSGQRKRLSFHPAKSGMICVQPDKPWHCFEGYLGETMERRGRFIWVLLNATMPFWANWNLYNNISRCFLPANSHDVLHTCSEQGATRGVTVSVSAFLACHQCYCAGSSLAWGLNLGAVVCGIFWSLLPGVFSGYSGFLPSFIGLMVQPIK